MLLLMGCAPHPSRPLCSNIMHSCRLHHSKTAARLITGNLQSSCCSWAPTNPHLGIHVVLLCCCDECWIIDVELQVAYSCLWCCVALTVMAHLPRECCERECISWGKTPMHANDVRHTGILGYYACTSTIIATHKRQQEQQQWFRLSGRQSWLMPR